MADKAVRRWRLLLGRYADEALAQPLQQDEQAQRVDRALDFLYGRGYAGRGVRGRGDPSGDKKGRKSGGTEGSSMTVPRWLSEVRELFPRATVEVLQKDALERYGMTELVTDPAVLRRLEPSYELLKSVLAFRSLLQGEVLALARTVVAKTVEELERRLSRYVRHALWGRLNRRRSSPLLRSGKLDALRTIRANLKSYDVERRRLVLERLYFYTRRRHGMPWHIIMAVDCSGSMLDSVIHSAVMAGIFAGLPAMRVSLVAFDTSVVDLSAHVADATEVLMSARLGGGTDIAGALGYCETLVTDPQRTILIVVTDFVEGGRRHELIAAIKRLRGAGVRVLGLAALDEKAAASYDRSMAQRCVQAGAEVAALTPEHLVDWLAGVLG